MVIGQAAMATFLRPLEKGTTKRRIRLAAIVNRNHDTPRYVLLFSTHVDPAILNSERVDAVSAIARIIKNY